MARARSTIGASVVALGVAIAACAPTFDWREARPQGSGVSLMFPCRPDRQERSLRLAGVEARMQLHSCTAGGARFSLAVLDSPSALDVGKLVGSLREQAVSNVGGKASDPARPPVAGATPNPGAGSLVIAGRRPDGSAVVEHAVFFVKGLQVFQATVLAGADRQPAEEAIATFFASIRLP